MSLPAKFSALAAMLTMLAYIPAGHAQEAPKHHHDHTHEEKATTGTKDHDHEGEDHDHEHHEHTAPHGGTLLVIGDHAAHLELVLDSEKGHLTAYVLDAEAEKAIRITQPEIKIQAYGGDLTTSTSIDLQPVASPLTGEKASNTSQFEARSDALKGKKNFTVLVEGLTIKGQRFDNTESKFPEGNH